MHRQRVDRAKISQNRRKNSPLEGKKLPIVNRPGFRQYNGDSEGITPVPQIKKEHMHEGAFLAQRKDLGPQSLLPPMLPISVFEFPLFSYRCVCEKLARSFPSTNMARSKTAGAISFIRFLTAPQASLWNPLTATDPDSTEITAGRRQTLGVTFSLCQGVSTAGDC